MEKVSTEFEVYIGDNDDNGDVVVGSVALLDGMEKFRVNVQDGHGGSITVYVPAECIYDIVIDKIKQSFIGMKQK